MLDEQDQGARIGVAVALGVVLLLIVGLLGWLTMRGGHKAPATALAQAVHVAPAAIKQAEGIASERIALRKPESTTVDGSSHEARRVEVRPAE
jgi:autotransporter translocation and assembly factor TamB